MEPQSDTKLESPFHTIPPLIIALTLLIVGIEAAFQLAENGMLGGPEGVGWRLAAIDQYGVSPTVLDRILVAGDYSFDMLVRFVAYPFINVHLTQVAFCAALTLALGKFTAEYYGSIKVAVLYLLTSIVGALVYCLLFDGGYPLLGGFTPVYGLIGAYTYALWLRLGQAGENQLLAFRLIGFLLLIQLIFGVMSGFLYQIPPPPTWIAELSGFIAGFAMSVLLAPGGWTTFVARMRDRS
ncbi:rhomboid family intramembrane serine protease [Loktanella sp. Alg231-35]|uniref:rhomboid family intramembrane serine protease n=1 Tax=Loktanella sp. Alg231-35 TaxID=1922220 RepID=UPI000D5593ED|nr:rhomboid family intramembrane serine protease [Loktanella sp. Alg231-35]